MAEYFERETVLKEIFSIYEREFPTASGAFDEFVTKTIPNILTYIPIADVVPVRRGKWEETDWVEPDWHGFSMIRTPNGGFRCSRCANVFKKELLWKENYCPNCGARMEVQNG